MFASTPLIDINDVQRKSGAFIGSLLLLMILALDPRDRGPSHVRLDRGRINREPRGPGRPAMRRGGPGLRASGGRTGPRVLRHVTNRGATADVPGD